MKQIFNPAVDADKYGNQLSEFLPPDARASKPKIRRKRNRCTVNTPRQSNLKRTVEGFEIRKDIPIPDIKKKQMGKWERLYKAMKVGECVVMDKVQSNRFQVWASTHGKRVSVRTVEGEVLVFKLRKEHSKKQLVTNK